MKNTHERITVRLLSWATTAQFYNKINEADVIEGYKPSDEPHSEYLRRVVPVCVQQGAPTVDAYIYVYPGSEPLSHWKRIPSGDWMRRLEE